MFCIAVASSRCQHSDRPSALPVWCVQVWNPEAPDDEVLAMVCRTGLNTVMGVMVKELLAPIRRYKERNPLLPVSAISLSTDNLDMNRNILTCQLS